MHLYSLGFKSLSMEPVIHAENFDYCITKENIPEIFKEYDLLCKKLIELKQNGKDICFFSFDIDLDKGPCVVKRLKGCGCGNDYVAITPNGDIFACHQFVGEDKFKMDVWYTRNVSFKTDWDIFWDTVRIVLKREGISSETSATMEEFMGTPNK